MKIRSKIFRNPNLEIEWLGGKRPKFLKLRRIAKIRSSLKESPIYSIESPILIKNTNIVIINVLIKNHQSEQSKKIVLKTTLALELIKNSIQSHFIRNQIRKNSKKRFLNNAKELINLNKIVKTKNQELNITFRLKTWKWLKYRLK